MKPNLTRGRSVGAAVLSACLGACAADRPAPNSQWAASQGDVGRAQAAGAEGVPAARLHLELAREDLATSKSLFDQDNRRAASLASLAQIEARLALSLAREALAANEAREAEDQLAKREGK